MSVAYSEIYDLFNILITDYKHLKLAADVQSEIKKGWLRISISKFKSQREILSDRDDIFEQFNQDLGEDIIVILAKLMVVEWLSPKLYSLDNLKNSLTPKDWNSYSPANLLKEIKSAYVGAKREAQALISAYNNDHFDLSELN